MKLQTQLRLLAVTTSLLLGGCFSSDDNDSTDVDNPPQTQSISINGASIKGLVLGGIVNVYPLTDTGVDRTKKLAEQTTTDATTGEYTITLLNTYAGETLFIEITAGDNSEMICDLASCGVDGENQPITFGGRYPLAADFSLSAIVNPVAQGTETVSANVSVLTNLASKQAQNLIASGTTAAEAKSKSDQQISNVFGINANTELSSLPALDITNPTAVAAADPAALEAALLGAAIVEATTSGNNGLSVEAALENFSNQFTQDGIADTEDQEQASVSLQEVLQSAQNLIAQVKTKATENNVTLDVSGLEADLEADENTASMGSTFPSQGTNSDDLGTTGVEAAKAFIADLRTLVAAADNDFATQQFVADVDEASAFVGQDLHFSSTAMNAALEIAAAAWEAYMESVDAGTPITSFTGEGTRLYSGYELAEVDMAGITVQITTADSGTTFAINQDISVNSANGSEDVAVTLSVTDGNITIEEVSEYLASEQLSSWYASYGDGLYDYYYVGEQAEEGTVYAPAEASESYEVSIDGELLISGSAVATASSITVSEGRLAVTATESGSEQVNLDENAELNSNTETFTQHSMLDLDSAEVSLQVSIVQTSTEHASVQFDGELAFSINDVMSDNVSVWSNSFAYSGETQSNEYTGEWEDNLSVADASFSLSGMLSTSAGESISASIALVADGGEGGFSEVCSGNYSHSYQWNYATGENSEEHSEMDSCENSETASSFTNVSIAINLGLDLEGIDDDITLSASFDRLELERGELTLEIVYSGNTFTMTYDSLYENRLTMTNHNKVKVFLTETEVEGTDGTVDYRLSGVINYDGAKVADITDNDGMVKITYIDETFESL